MTNAWSNRRDSREWAVPSCSACLRIVERRYGYRPGDDVTGPLGRGVVDAVMHAEGTIQVMVTFDGFPTTVAPHELTFDPDGASARKTATWVIGR